jgi:peptidoglycan hydrolase CwlO-like protein
MDFLQLLTNSAWLTALSTLIGSVITYLIARNKNKTKLVMSDRMQLSKDQYQLIAEMRQMMQEQREEIESLREEIKQLQAVNITLTLENKELQAKIAELNERLDSRLNS